MRQIVLDTETTGINHEAGHRIIEIGCVELLDRKLTGNHFHVYINPDREVDEGAFRVHGISTEFLQDKPRFKDIADEFLKFICDSELIIHNAPFDVGFINAELMHLKHPDKLNKYCNVLDTLVMAKEKHPGQRNSLDALCKRYEIDNSHRQLHGALLDAEILALVYLAMTGGQTSLFGSELEEEQQIVIETETIISEIKHNIPIYHASEEELSKHSNFIEFLVKKSGVNRWEETTE
ncbi:DNA polymerase III subunit epsilon [Legionella birminghamensis]|uniref:DNA polymerase III subunit epsilon n=1 Tax=Legionella birminghamensis TaxID=28083 RepID=A0A378IHE9_9GAMM|nr:DNA polymerase III subunit epsilon [Legionella birminghamensis]KTC69341.1 DNA polymerase III subunit epsilon [Legionella birminghamensis]STX31604.1 DNA polymerase III subunit epsilon [Legionella birminghamensis]